MSMVQSPVKSVCAKRQRAPASSSSNRPPGMRPASVTLNKGVRPNPSPTGIWQRTPPARALPIDYFVRLIGRESGFNPTAVSAKGALGIAQFMPGTAALRGLKDPFDPHQALLKSAEYLK